MTAATPAQVLCSPWATHLDLGVLTQPIPSRLDDVQPAQWDAYLEIASEILYALSGRRWAGGCEETVTLRSRPPGPGQGAWPYNSTWGECGCWNYGSLMDNWLYPPINMFVGTHLAPMAIRLPHEPVIGIQSVTVDGNAFTDYRYTESGWLERTDNLPWVVCEDSTTVDYSYGQLPPAAGKDAVIRLAIEFAKYDVGLECALPERVTSVTRQGITFAMIDPMQFIPLGKTGIYKIDMWLQSVNPYANKQRARVFSPDLPTTIHNH
jgi:hypothetical protein